MAVRHDAAVTTSDPSYLARFEQLGRFFMGTSNVHATLARLARRLGELEIPYAVCGGMALNAHGYQRATTDVDVVITEVGLAKFKACSLGLGWLEKFQGSRGVRDTDNRVPVDFLVTGGIPGDGAPSSLRFPDPADVAIEIAGIRYVSLAKLIEMKLASGLTSPARIKDLADVLELIRGSSLGEHFADALDPFVRAKFMELWRLAQERDGLGE
jgi:hypothetical protein